jgi:branched-chain amino acid transport system substrate-binding protein
MELSLHHRIRQRAYELRDAGGRRDGQITAEREVLEQMSLEGYLAGTVLVEALKRNGPQLDTERLVDSLENLRDFDMGLGTPVTFGRSEHQALHKVWGTELDATGHYQPIDLQ